MPRIKMLFPFQSLVIKLLIAMATLNMAAMAEEDEASLIPLGSHHIARELGTDVEFPCDKPKDGDIQWVLPSAEVASKNSSVDRITQLESILRIRNVSWDDSGNYTCMLINGSRNDTLLFKVFIMPSYYLEGIIIVCINSALLLLFLICLAISAVRYKMIAAKERKRKGSKNYKYKPTKNSSGV